MNRKTRATARWGLLLSALAAVTLWGTGAAAQLTGQRLELSMEGCEDLDEAALRYQLQVEMAGLTELDSDLLPLRVEIKCGRDSARLGVSLAETSSFERSLSLSGVDEKARERLAALIVIELALYAIEAQTRPEPAEGEPAPAEGEPEPVEEEPEPGQTTRAVGLSLSLGVTGALSSNAPSLLGGVAQVGVWPWERLGFAVELGLASSGAQTSLGPAKIFLGDGALSVLTAATSGAWRLEAGGGLRLGSGQISPDSSDPTLLAAEVSGLWGGPLAKARVHLQFTPSLHIGADIEAGLATAEVSAIVAGQPELALDELWIRAALLSGFSF